MHFIKCRFHHIFDIPFGSPWPQINLVGQISHWLTNERQTDMSEEMSEYSLSKGTTKKTIDTSNQNTCGTLLH